MRTAAAWWMLSQASSGSTRPQPRQQPRLPTWDTSDRGGDVHIVPPPELVIPSGPDPLFMRADFGGVTLDANRWGGLQRFKDAFLVGSNTTPYTCLMSPFVVMYPRWLQDAYLTESAERNLTHFVFASEGWGFRENHFAPSPAQLVEWAQYLESWGFLPTYWGPERHDDPFLQALVDANAVAFHIVGEEVDSKMSAEQYEALLDNALAITGNGIPTAAHFTSNYPDGFPRDTFLTNWAKYDGLVHLCWQANCFQSAGTQGAMLYYARERVNLGQVGGNGIPALKSRVFAFETMATCQLNPSGFTPGRPDAQTEFGTCSEAYGNLRGLQLLYTTRRDDRIRPVSGTGNGGNRLPDGSPF